MINATPEQIQLYRHRRRVSFFVGIGIPVVGFISGVTLVHFFHDSGRVAMGFFLGCMIMAFISQEVFRYFYFRCPACSHALCLPRRFKIGGFYKAYCIHCDTDYAV